MGQNPNDPESERRIARRRERRRQAALRKARGRRRRDGWGGDGAPGVSVPLGLLELDPDRIPPLGPLGEVGAVGPTAYYARKVPYAFVSAASDHPLARRKPRVYTVRFPEVFSFIDAPEDALRLIERAVVAFARSPTRRVSIDQARCRQIDYGAASVLCALALDAERRYGVRLTGTYPRDARAREIVEATGLPKLLGLVEDTPAHFLSFELQCGRRGRRGASAASDRDRIATAFVEHLDECLQAYAVELSPDGKHYVSQLFTEAIGNAEDHGGRQEWWVGGYLRRPPGSAVGDLNVTIFNLGNTVYQTLAQLPPSSTLGVRLRGIVKRHRDAGAYGPAYSEEETWTLGAIQEGVSRVNDQVGALGHRGTGTYHMVETFRHISRPADGQFQPKMVVVSGRSRIVFDGEHQMVDTPTENGETRPIIAFNETNDLRLPPDPRNVHRLERVFPGTLISLRVYLDAVHLDRLAHTSP